MNFGPQLMQDPIEALPGPSCPRVKFKSLADSDAGNQRPTVYCGTGALPASPVGPKPAGSHLSKKQSRLSTHQPLCRALGVIPRLLEGTSKR